MEVGSKNPGIPGIAFSNFPTQSRLGHAWSVPLMRSGALEKSRIVPEENGTVTYIYLGIYHIKSNQIAGKYMPVPWILCFFCFGGDGTDSMSFFGWGAWKQENKVLFFICFSCLPCTFYSEMWLLIHHFGLGILIFVTHHVFIILFVWF